MTANRRSKWKRVAGAICLGIAALLWSLFTGRVSALFVSLLLCIVLAAGSLRKRAVVGALVAVVVILPLQPFDITLRGIPGPPRFLTCCPGVPYRDYEGTLAKQEAGVCAFCSDLVTGFEPEYMLFW